MSHQRSTLFAYTTLFRSRLSADREPGPTWAGRSACNCERRDCAASPCATDDRRTCERTARRDRKSTRLNSSHITISYAVFCLKKKKKSTNTIHTSTDTTL